MSKRKKSAKSAKFEDGLSVTRAGGGTSCDFSTGQVPAGAYGYPSSLRPGSEQYLFGVPIYDGPFADNYFAAMYRSHWEARKIVNIVADDMTREGWRWTAADRDAEELEAIGNEEERLGIVAEVNLALIYERLFGGSVLFLGLAGNENNPEKPVEFNRISKGDLRFARAIPRHRISGTDLNNDPLSEHYNRPELFHIGGRTVHRSRLLVFSGRHLDLPVLQFRRGDGFGDSILASLYQDINYAQGARQSVRHLIDKASVAFFESEKAFDMAGTTQGEANLTRLGQIINAMSNYHGVVLGKGEKIGNYSATFTGAAEAMMQFLQVLSAASDIPATRFLGEAPGGLNTDGDSQLQNYLGSTVPSMQTNRLRPQLVTLGQVLSRSVFGETVPGLIPEFNPLWTPSASEVSENEKKDEESVRNMTLDGLLDEEAAIKILRQISRKFEYIDDDDVRRILAQAEEDDEELIRAAEIANGMTSGEEEEGKEPA